jgi:hypothetical protein
MRRRRKHTRAFILPILRRGNSQRRFAEALSAARIARTVMCELSVVVTELRKEKGIAFNLVDHPMLVIYPAGPVAGERVL